jgi:hypothetical protein
MKKRLAWILATCVGGLASAQSGERARVGGRSMDRTEITVRQFKSFADAHLVTTAER